MKKNNTKTPSEKLFKDIINALNQFIKEYEKNR